MDEARQEEIIKALESKKATQSCPRCSTLQFEVIGETTIPLTMSGDSMVWSAAQIPVVLVSCTNCGFIAQHASGPLGIVRRS